MQDLWDGIVVSLSFLWFDLTYFKIDEVLKLYTSIKKLFFYLKGIIKIYNIKIIQPITKKLQNIIDYTVFDKVKKYIGIWKYHLFWNIKNLIQHNIFRNRGSIILGN